MDIYLTSHKTDTDLFTDLVTRRSGLTHQERSARLADAGPNQISSHQTSWLRLLLKQFASPFIYLLIGAAGIAYVLGETLDSMMILLFVTINSLLGFFQEHRSEQAIKLLRKYLVSKSRVVSDGKEQVIDTTALVPGDVVLLEPGDLVPADVRFIESTGLTVDESVITGESAPVNKHHQPLSSPAKDIYSAANLGFSGTVVVSGKAAGIVVATGKGTAYGHIATLTVQTVKKSLFEQEIARFSKFTLALVSLTLVLVVVASVIIKQNPSLGQLAVFSVALAVSVIPEALPLVITFSLSLGALRLAKHGVVVKRLSAIEDLGSIQVLASDKTGTLTENKLTVSSWYQSADTSVRLLASLASTRDAKERNAGNSSFESAIFQSLTEAERREAEAYTLLREYPFDPDRRRASTLVAKSSRRQLIVRGAPETVLALCRKDPDHKQAIAWLATEEDLGHRVLAIAVGAAPHGSPEKLDTLPEKDLTLTGFISFTDPVKPTTVHAIDQARRMGVAVKILTGDSAKVAGSVAREIRLIDDAQQVITGAQFEALSPHEQHLAVENFHVFARVSPQQKYRIIELLQEKHEIGFLGEGINDAPALKIAHVALAVQSASDIAKDAADIVLLQRSLNVIVDGIKQGRFVFANTTKYITATLSANFGNFFAVAFASLLIPYLPMLPLQILLLNLLSDFPMISIATDSVDDATTKHPRRYDLKSIALIAILLGIVSTVFDFLFFAVFSHGEQTALQTNWFMGSVLTELAFLFSIRSRRWFFRSTVPSVPIIALSSVAFAITIVLPYTVLGTAVFKFRPPSAGELAAILALVGMYFITSETVKMLYYTQGSRHDTNAFDNPNHLRLNKT